MDNAVDDIFSSLDFNQLADLVGADPNQVQQATAAALPALFGGLEANAQDPAGANSILQALGQHDPSMLDGGVDLSRIDANDGAAIAQHIFGNNTDAVYNQLGQYSAAGGLGGTVFRRLLPILAPIVLSYVMKQMTQRAGGGRTSGGAGGGGLGDILGQILGGGQAQQDTSGSQVDPNALPQSREQQIPVPQQPSQSSSGQGGSGQSIDDVLKDVLGSATQQSSQAQQQRQDQQPAGGGILGDILGGLLGGGRR